MDDGYDDDFEDYNDSFEDEIEEKPVAPPQSNKNYNVSSKIPAPVVASGKEDSFLRDIAKSVEIENAAALERLTLTKSESKRETSEKDFKRETQAKSEDVLSLSQSTSVRRTKKYGGTMVISQESTLKFDPRYRRLSKLRSSEILDLQEEKFSNFQLAPSSPYDIYSRLLHADNPVIRQEGCPAENEQRDVESITDDVEMKDKEMQFCFGDDTTFLNILQAIEKSKHGNAAKNDLSVMEILQLSRKDQNNSQEEVSMKALEEVENLESSRMTTFLQRASRVMESLLDEDLFAEGKKASSSQFNTMESKDLKGSSNSCRCPMFSKEFDWERIGTLMGDGSNELIRSRMTSFLRFSELQPHVLLTIHPYVPPPPGQDDLDEDLRPFKSLYAIWETGRTQSPAYLLESSGSPTCAAFSKTQSYLVAAGTAEGGLFLWDLRENHSIHKDRDAVDLHIDRGIRKPCYSTHSLKGTLLDDSNGGQQQQQQGNVFSATTHMAPILFLDSLGDSSLGSSSSSTTSWRSNSIMSQFISMDASGNQVKVHS